MSMYNSYIHYHIVSQVLVLCDQGAVVLIFETNSPSLVYPIEILDSCHNRISGIMRIYEHSHGNACSNLRVLIEEELKGNLFGLVVGGTLALGPEGPTMRFDGKRIVQRVVIPIVEFTLILG